LYYGVEAVLRTYLRCLEKETPSLFGFCGRYASAFEIGFVILAVVAGFSMAFLIPLGCLGVIRSVQPQRGGEHREHMTSKGQFEINDQNNMNQNEL
jgi:hypothetical protein